MYNFEKIIIDSYLSSLSNITDFIKRVKEDDSFVNYVGENYQNGSITRQQLSFLKSINLLTQEQYNDIIRNNTTDFYEDILYSNDTMCSLNTNNYQTQFPLISVIIPVYNRKDVIENAIISIYDTHYPNLEIIISDDASDESYNFLYDKYKDIRIIRSSRNYGAGVARQRGIDVCRGDYICFLDSDDELNSSMFDFIACNPKTNYDVISFKVQHRFDDEYYEYYGNCDQITHGKLFRHKFLIEKKIRFDPNFRYYEDSYFTRLAIKSTTNHYIVDEVGYYMIDNEKSTTKSQFDSFLKDTAYENADMNCTFYERHQNLYNNPTEIINECISLSNHLYELCDGGDVSIKAIFRIFDCYDHIWGIENVDISTFLNPAGVMVDDNIKLWYNEWKKTFDNIKLSIIIPIYNSHEYIQSTLKDLYNLICDHLDIVEVILTDDNSSDPYYSYLLKEFPFIHILSNPETVRMGKNRNRGLNVAKGKWITFLDHDDRFFPEAIQDILSEQYNDTVNIIRGYNRNVCELGSKETYDYTCIELLHGVFYRREFLKKYNIEFSPFLNTSEDSFFNRRAFAISSIYYGENSIVDKHIPYYDWKIHDKSTMHQLYNGREYTEEFYPEYVKACILAFDTEVLPEKSRILNFIFLIRHAEYFLPIWKASSKNFRKANIKILCGILITLQDRYNIGKDIQTFMNQYKEDFEKHFGNDISYFGDLKFYFTHICFDIIENIDDDQRNYLKNLLLK